tara:strand:- start:241 stop:1137 length:897 start_codon:yes stop_codon:yes gene_type:complete
LKFSIILPTYNRANLISKAIRSVVYQTYQNWELIVVDDGSTDNTKKVVEEFVRADNRIIYLSQKNKERSAARNNGIKSAVGELICFLDSDDLYYKTHLEEFKKFITESKFQKGLYFSGLSYGKYCNEKEEYNLSYSNNIEFVLINTIGTPRACISKELLKENLFNENIRISEDKELWVRILKNNPLFYHRQKTFIEIEHPQRSVNLGSDEEHLNTIKFILRNNKQLINKNIRSQSLSDAYFNISKSYIKNKALLKAIYYTILSLLTSLRNHQTRHKLLLLLSMLNLYSNKVKNEYKEP